MQNPQLNVRSKLDPIFHKCSWSVQNQKHITTVCMYKVHQLKFFPEICDVVNFAVKLT